MFSRPPAVAYALLLGCSTALPGVARAQKPPVVPSDTPPTSVPPPASGPAAPFAFADFSWVPGNLGAPERPLSFGPVTGEIRVDTAYHYSFANPKDDTISGSSEVFRHGEFQVTQLGFGGDFLYKGVMARMMTQFGMYSQTTPRNDAAFTMNAHPAPAEATRAPPSFCPRATP